MINDESGQRLIKPGINEINGKITNENEPIELN